MAVDIYEHDIFIEKLLRENDDTPMPLPDLESEPHLLISKVRKHYMDYVIKLLSINYETNQKLVNKNIYLPSAIWRCAKTIETKAAQACMVAQLYRKNIISVVNELKNDTRKGKLNRKLYECLNKPPQNDKKIQTQSSSEKDCPCGHMKRKRRPVNTAVSPKSSSNTQHPPDIIMNNNYSNSCIEMSAVVNNSLSALPKMIPQPASQIINQNVPLSPQKPVHRTSVESDPDELMIQLDKLFESNHNDDDDDIFEAFCDRLDTTLDTSNNKGVNINLTTVNTTQDSVIENQAAVMKSLDERLASLNGLVVNNENVVIKEVEQNKKSHRRGSSKWFCEEYYLKQKLYELLDQIGDDDRRSLEKIKHKFEYYFGYDSDDEGIVSPLEETPEFVVSCKERIAPWVVKILTPYYIKGHIVGKAVFKSLAKHLIRLIYQCSRYPAEYEVSSFVMDFLKNHKSIRCEADYKEFRIDNI